MADQLTLSVVNFGMKISETWLTPILKNLKKNFDVSIENLTHSFADYLDRTHQKHSYLQTIVFPNQQVLLKDLYIPLEIISTNNQANRFVLNCYLDNFLPVYTNVLIVDTAGMGKSTLLKFLFLRAVERNIGIPILIELRKLSKENTILDFICSELSSIKIAINRDFIAQLIEAGNFIFFFDGYDEIQTEHREFVTQDIQDFRTKANKNLFILTSREEQGLASFSEFQRFNIRPLLESEAYDLIKKYDQANKLSEALIKKLQEPEYSQVKEFLTNPLLVSLLYKSFEYKPTVPLKRPIFYRQVYEALFENHDFSKGGEFQRKKKSSLDIDQFHSMLRALGFITYKEGKTEFDSEELLQCINKAKGFCTGLDFSSSDFRNDLINQVPLLVKDGNFYRWSHKSIQEYFAACYICMDSKENESEILKSIYNNTQIDTYMSMFTLCYDIDFKRFNRVIILELAKEFISLYQSSYLDCIDSISEKLINDRKELTAYKYITFINSDGLHALNDMDSPNDTFSDAHMKASEITSENTGIKHSSARTNMTWPSAMCFTHHRLNGLITYLSNKDEVAFIIPINSDGVVNPTLKLNKKIKFQYLNDSKANLLNSKRNFKIVNGMIEDQSLWKFDFKKAMETVRKIESEITHESKTNLNF